MMLSLAVLLEYRLVTDGRTIRQTDRLTCGKHEKRQLRGNSIGYKKLSYRRGDALLENFCFMLFTIDTGVRKVSNNKSDLLGHSRALAMDSPIR